MTAASGIFISYRRKDSGYAAVGLYDRLKEQFGAKNVFKDVDNLQPGDDFVDSITKALASCDVLLALIGPQWDTITDEQGRRIDDPGDFVRIEIENALRKQVRVIPVLVDGASMPARHRLPASLEPFARRQAIQLTSARFERDAAERNFGRPNSHLGS